MVKRLELENALKIAIDDEVVNDHNITLQEMKSIKKRFDELFDTLKDEAEDEDMEVEDGEDIEDDEDEGEVP